MAKPTKCSPIEEKWCQAYVNGGMNKSDAWRYVHPTKDVNDNVASQSGHRLSKRPQVLVRVEELLREVQATDLCSPGRSVQMMLDAHTAAVQAELPGVQATCARELMRLNGLLQDKLQVDSGGAQRDEEVIQAITSDPVKQQQLRAILGSDEAFQPLRVVGEPEP